MTLKQYYSRTRNAHAKLISATNAGSDARQEMFRLTGKQKYRDKAFLRRAEKGRTFTIKEVRKDLSAMEKKKKNILKRRHKKLKASGKTKLTQKAFLRANAHATSIDFESQQILYDSP